MAYYFASDVHAGLSLDEFPVDSEARLIDWLEQVSADAEAIYLVGDIFDFWFEYKRAIPTGYDRLLAKLQSVTGQGIPVYFLGGNHDMWTRDYLGRACGITIVKGKDPLCVEHYGKRLLILHGDGLGSMKAGERLMHRLFRSPMAYRIFTTLVSPQAAMRFGRNWSSSNRKKHRDCPLFRQEAEGVVQYARDYLKNHAVDYFVFGHLHCPTEYKLSEQTTLYVLGDWISDEAPVYGKLTPAGFSLERFHPRRF